nr:hypothetical protein CFP56_59547 [Quercus suber]
MVYLLFGVRTGWQWRSLDQATEVLVRTLAKPVDSGRGYGDCRFPTRCVILHGEPVEAYYLLRRIFSEGKSSWTYAILMTDSHEEKDAKPVVTVAWVMWFNRNEVWHGGRKKSDVALFQWYRQYLQEFQEANQLVPSIVMPKVVGCSVSDQKSKAKTEDRPAL